MKTTRKIALLSKTLLFALTLFVSQTYAQEYSLNNATSELTVFGTSNLHDWEVKAEKQSGKLALDRSGQLQIKLLQVSVETESLKSGKSGMDKNTYKALKTNKHKSISFDMKEVKSISKLNDNSYRVSVTGNLTIAGVTKNTGLDFIIEVASSQVILKGSKSFKMTDFGVDPPKALLGTVTTGDEVKIEFKTVFK